MLEPIYNFTLPITAKKDEIINSILDNQVVIISGETGSGKTTQIPKFCIAAKRGIRGKIGCTQPRRIAAITIAKRIAEEFGEEIGNSVGYKIRFKDKTSNRSVIKIMTDGILLAETISDPYLNQYDTIIIDEAHERSLNIDFILGFLRNLLRKRRQLKVIITSATIDTEKFSKAFDGAPVIEVSGRMYPVETRYNDEMEKNDEQNYIDITAQVVENLQKQSPFGDILVFMPTEQDIRETCGLLKENQLQHNAEILPLYARLSSSEQSRVFSRGRSRKIIVATNIAETSITIPGIKYVIDTGLARILQYNPHSRITSLPIKPISQSSANQRMGRCGRVENGVCIRLFSEQDFQSFPLFTSPEILRANLAEVILKMTALNLGDISDFPFIDKPAPKRIKDGFDTLLELDAIAYKSRSRKSKKRFLLTENGKLMAKLPVDPRLSRMIIEAQKQGCVKEIAVIISALSLQDPRERPVEKALEASQAHKQFNDLLSDFVSLLNIWNSYHDTLRKTKSVSQTRKFCKNNYISFKRMREWRDIHAQITNIVKEYGLIDKKQNQQINKKQISSFSPTYISIHKAILTGFLSNIAVKKEKNIFKVARGREAMIFPGSGLFNKAGQWIVVNEMVETSRLFARVVANIDCAWLEELGGRQCKYSHFEPHWEKNRGEVVASEQVSLYGLIIIPKRPVSYGKINPDEASDIFIQSAIVENNLKILFPFMEHNIKLIDEIKNAENKFRRRDILVSEHELFQFYKKKLDGIYDVQTLKKRIKQQNGDDFLKMSKTDIINYFPDENEMSLFPNDVVVGNKKFDYVYKFAPGANDDGVTIKIPATHTTMIPPESLDWLVPGFYKDKITALIKALPKQYRKQLVPIANAVNIIIKEMPKIEKSETCLMSTLGNFIYKRFCVNVPMSAWTDDETPAHLKMRVSIIDSKGREIDSGRDKLIFNRNIVNKINDDEFEAVRKQWEKTEITQWDFGDILDVVAIKGKNGAEWTCYPSLKCEKNSVSLRLFQDRKIALKFHKKAVALLFTIHFSKDLKFLKKSLTLSSKLKYQAKYFGGIKALEKQLYESVINNLFCKNIKTKEDFYSHAKSVASLIISTGRNLLEKGLPVLMTYSETRDIIYSIETANNCNKAVAQFCNGLRENLAKLVPETFLQTYNIDKFDDIARYVKAIAIRAQRAFVNFEKDQTKAKEVIFFTDKLRGEIEGLSTLSSNQKKQAVEEYFWLIEEYKVSLFAQELKTPFPISKKRLEQKLKEIEKLK